MIRKVLLMLCSSAIVSAGVVGTDYTPTSSVSYSSISSPTVSTISTPVFEKTITAPIGYTKLLHSPPAYQAIVTTKASDFDSPHQHTTYTKSLDTAYSSLKKYESKLKKDNDVISNTIPVYHTGFHTPIVYHAETAYTVSSPLIHTVHAPALPKAGTVPITYATNSVPLTKTIVTPSITSYTTPVLKETKVVTSGLSTFSSHTPLIESQPVKTNIIYSEAPLVSHMSFTGLGASYAW